VGPKIPTGIDRLVGSRVRQRRMQLGLSQEQLAGQLGITVPQVHKYEMGLNRISPSRLYKITSLLEVPIWFFFEAHQGEHRASSQATRPCAGFGRNPH
jgi:transcriptional regulator with XRE-family HTH domain